MSGSTRCKLNCESTASPLVQRHVHAQVRNVPASLEALLLAIPDDKLVASGANLDQTQEQQATHRQIDITISPRTRSARRKTEVVQRGIQFNGECMEPIAR
jgi:hypothetical protein